MLGGIGTEEAYKAVDPAKPSILFPNKKVVGGIDLVGTEFDSASGSFAKHLPHPDENPLDESGHGSHVAGTVAGVGDGDSSYDGVAPDAQLYAIKVFGKEGSTSDAVVMAALEFAADPTGAGTGAGRMDVVNLSLGSSYGNPHILYGEAVRNLSAGGTVMVASAGNEGPYDYIVGAPSVADEAISVAASIDNAAHNWKFNAIRFDTPSQGAVISEVIEGPISKPVADAGNVSGKLVLAGIADVDFTQELKDQIKGNVAFIDRGKVMFSEKVRRAFEAGAIGVIVANNQPGDAFSMGGDGHYEIPAVMITQANADIFKVEMKKGEVLVHFQTPEKIERPQLIDTLTSFSSKGPRTSDGLLKPEISAPGYNVISAAMGKGKTTVQMSGTSMAGPHVTGVMALLKQVHPELSPADLKSLVMGRAVTITDDKKQIYPITRQGAGRVQVDAAAVSLVVASKPSLSFGEQNIETKKMVRTSVRVKNISAEDHSFKVIFEGSSFVRMIGPANLTLKAGETGDITLGFVLDASQLKDSAQEFDGWVKFLDVDHEAFRIPMLATVHRISQVKAEKLIVHSTSAADAAGSAVDVKLSNSGVNSGRALLFNLLGQNPRKQDPSHDDFKNRGCALDSAGYRIIEKTVEGQKIKVLQVAAKLYEPMTTWHTCEISVLLDSNGDDQPDQELALVALANVKGLSNGSNDNQIASILLDATKAREIRKNFELAVKAAADPAAPPPAAGAPKAKTPVEDYAPALVDASLMRPFNHSTVAIVEADISKLARTPTGEISVKIATIHQEASAVQMDDYLGDGLNSWKKISLEEGSQGFQGMPETINLNPGDRLTVPVDKGEGSEDMLILMPDNRSVSSDVQLDSQGVIMKPSFEL
jgi:subtilisin family serine protease